MNRLGKRERDPYFDSLKLILTALVVMGHALQADLESGNRLLFTTYTFTQIFRIPLFVFISGFFSKNMTWEKYKKSFLSLIVMYYLFQFFYSFNAISEGRFDVLSFILESAGPMWYILALIVWRGFFSVLPKFKYDAFILITLSLAASLIAGYKIFPIIHESVRIIVFFPYFVMGYYCNVDLINKIRRWNGFLPFFALILGFIATYDYVNPMFRLSLYGTFSYKVLFHEDPVIGFYHRVTSIVLAIFFGMMILNLATSNFARWGKKTVYIYLFHPIIMFYIYFNILEFFDIKQTFFGNMLMFPVVVLICIYISKFKFIQFLVNPVDYLKKRKKERSSGYSN